MNQFIKKSRRAIARAAMLCAYWLVCHLPFSLVSGFLHGVMSLAFRFTFRLRRIARESLQTAFGEEKTKEEIERIIDRCFATIRCCMVELLFYSRNPERVTEIFTLEGRERLDGALKKGNGVILVTAHFGNFPLMMLALAQMGYKVNCILRRARDGKIADVILGIMTRVGVKTIYTQPRRKCVLESITALRNNEILFVLMDQNFGNEGGIFVDFFGRKAATATGPVVLGMKNQAAVLPVFALRENTRHRVVFEPEMVFEIKNSEEETILVNTQRLTNIIEQYIRRYPWLWGWMHRRWKSQEIRKGKIKISAAEE